MNRKTSTGLAVLAWAFILIALYMTSLQSYILFHSVAEIFSVIIACGIFMVAWNSRRFLDNDYLLFIGCAYVFVACIDIIHTLAYKGMGVFPGHGADLPTQLWIAARYMESLSLLIAPVFLRRKLSIPFVVSAYFFVSAVLLLSIFHWRLFPVCFVEGTGLTPFKKISEYVISLIMLGAMTLLLRNRSAFDRNVLRLVVWSIVATILSEFAFVFYVSVYGFSNLAGHYLKIVSFYFVYKAIIEKGLTQPYNLFFRNLKHSEEMLKKRGAQLEEAVKDLESFSYSISHDLKAPLRVIAGFANILEKDHAGQLGEEGRRLLGRVVASSRKMEKLIDDILAFSRAGRKEIKMTEIDMEAMARSVIEEIRAANPARNLKIDIKALPPAVGDPPSVRQVLLNLVSNAVKFTITKNVAIIEIHGKQDDNENVYFIRDNGAGFDGRYADKLFGLFQRLHDDHEFEGTGVGLAVVKRFINKLGGRVWAEGKPNEGATFYFSLPKGKWQPEVTS